MSLLKNIETQGLMFDGAMGTMLIQAGLESGTVPETWVLERPEEIIKVHQGYADAGADVLITNTFGGNPIKLKKAGLDKKTEQINKVAAGLTKSIAKDQCLVAGNIGPTGELIQAGGTISEEAVKDCFAAQAQALVQGGVDLFLVQTFFNLKEIISAIQGIQSVSDLPVFASMTFQEYPKGFSTIMGDSVEYSMNALKDANALVVGANCSLGSDRMVLLAKEVRRAVSTPVMVAPNAGSPVVRQGKTRYSEDARTFSENMYAIKKLGVEVLGGCCGTTPEYIRQTIEKTRVKKQCMLKAKISE
ncbi:5-methyltetrahydrofolate--homocysteine methyltransferase [Desulfocicer vacuolatum DSM 3385]|uniref:5-methyltetrahydrofolate--homocysteine methyltransferase n=1 Tax=Desulfocicer vacuolatum DSM 3385 TaxID=1121400 RepID=A0A1W2DVV0_9BACT|nr:homocysteine S-methyltransferase family protein [Desulfocicer vacuolatum]SMD01665.1 5-methyltetrahydrofolate--homocysteine methyltransferase [Desulfocicer vacuolatum DSM 3385]